MKTYLTHDHLWVRLISCQLFGHLFAAQTLDDLLDSTKKTYFTFSTDNKFIKVSLKLYATQSFLNSQEIFFSFFQIRDLIDAFCVQLKSPVLDNELAEQIVKNLAFMAKIINRCESELENPSHAVELGHDMNMIWLIKKMLKEAKFELVNKPKETLKVKF